jgi:AGCS family alanine or glycine:cation symporter
MTLAWSVADITMGLDAIINIIAILLLSGIAIKALKDYEKALEKDGKNYELSIGVYEALMAHG